jgi:hypothetical protein
LSFAGDEHPLSLRSANNPLDREFVVELERITERTRGELEQFRQTD